MTTAMMLLMYSAITYNAKHTTVTMDRCRRTAADCTQWITQDQLQRDAEWTTWVAQTTNESNNIARIYHINGWQQHYIIFAQKHMLTRDFTLSLQAKSCSLSWLSMVSQES